MLTTLTFVHLVLLVWLVVLDLTLKGTVRQCTMAVLVVCLVVEVVVALFVVAERDIYKCLFPTSLTTAGQDSELRHVRMWMPSMPYWSNSAPARRLAPFHEAARDNVYTTSLGRTYVQAPGHWNLSPTRRHLFVLPSAIWVLPDMIWGRKSRREHEEPLRDWWLAWAGEVSTSYRPTIWHFDTCQRQPEPSEGPRKKIQQLMRIVHTLKNPHGKYIRSI